MNLTARIRRQIKTGFSRFDSETKKLKTKILNTWNNGHSFGAEKNEMVVIKSSQQN